MPPQVPRCWRNTTREVEAVPISHLLPPTPTVGQLELLLPVQLPDKRSHLLIRIRIRCLNLRCPTERCLGTALTIPVADRPTDMAAAAEEEVRVDLSRGVNRSTDRLPLNTASCTVVEDNSRDSSRIGQSI